MSVHQVRSMRHNWPRNHPDDHCGREYKPQVLRLEAAIAEQRRDKRRLHAETRIEQGVGRHEGQERRWFPHGWRIAAHGEDCGPAGQSDYARRKRSDRPGQRIREGGQLTLPDVSYPGRHTKTRLLTMWLHLRS